MKIRLLGTGTSQGVPIIACNCKVCTSVHIKDKRLRTSALIQVDNQNIVIDTGPDFRQQMLRSKIKRLDAILFTHFHKDHIAGFDDIRGFNLKMKQAINTYLDQSVMTAIKKDFQYMFEAHTYPGIPKANFNIIDLTPFYINNTKIIPIQVMHHLLPVLGFRIKDFTYITDANYIDDENLNKMQDSNVLVINALRQDSHISHFNLEQAIEISKKVNAKKTYITHISHQMGLHNQINKILPKNIKLAYDGLQLIA